MIRTRIGLALSTAVITALGLLGMPTVASAQPSPTAPGGGMTTTEPSSGPSAGANDGMLRDVLHGEGVVQTKNGPVRVAIQKGTITSITTSSVAVKSSDGWSRTWTLGNNVRVYEHRNTLQPKALTAGSEITVAGTVSGNNGASGGTYTAKVVHLHSRAGAQPSPSETQSPEGTPTPEGTSS
ncbi:hypothetical protein [Dactylosporangium darangshiense]|uniref:DUF5666 domain-containing protein n=1 Tax=Dactylosporangium darangshiense TaxID=579108 RepID=A0ABP8DUS9_9ACTN